MYAATHSDLEVDGYFITTNALGSEVFNDGVVGVDVSSVLDVEWERDVGIGRRWELDVCLVTTTNQSIIDGVVDLECYLWSAARPILEMGGE